MLYDLPDLQINRLDGRSVSLGDYRGQLLLIVNTASECGLTPQYDGLERIHETYAARGLRVLGFPANEFGKQEPGSNAEIQSFCTVKFGVQFDMFAKIVVKGEGQAPLYRFLTETETQPVPAGDVSWNFEKFLVDPDGRVIARFSPSTEPLDPALVAVIEKNLPSATP